MKNLTKRILTFLCVTALLLSCIVSLTGCGLLKKDSYEYYEDAFLQIFSIEHPDEDWKAFKPRKIIITASTTGEKPTRCQISFESEISFRSVFMDDVSLTAEDLKAWKERFPGKATMLTLIPLSELELIVFLDEIEDDELKASLCKVIFEAYIEEHPEVLEIITAE